MSPSKTEKRKAVLSATKVRTPSPRKNLRKQQSQSPNRRNLRKQQAQSPVSYKKLSNMALIKTIIIIGGRRRN